MTLEEAAALAEVLAEQNGNGRDGQPWYGRSHEVTHHLITPLRELREKAEAAVRGLKFTAAGMRCQMHGDFSGVTCLECYPARPGPFIAEIQVLGALSMEWQSVNNICDRLGTFQVERVRAALDTLMSTDLVEAMDGDPALYRLRRSIWLCKLCRLGNHSGHDVGGKCFRGIGQPADCACPVRPEEGREPARL